MVEQRQGIGKQKKKERQPRNGNRKERGVFILIGVGALLIGTGIYNIVEGN